MNFGINLRARPLGKEIFLVDRYTRSPLLNGAGRRFRLAAHVCFTRAESMLSWADIIASFCCSAKLRTEGNSVVGERIHSMDCGMRPEFKKNGAKPVLSERAELMANSIAGSLTTQSFWLGSTHCHNIWVIVRLARSVEPSDWGGKHLTVAASFQRVDEAESRRY
jgi:hypothetical protein